MAEKEERIFIQRISVCENPKDNDMYKCECEYTPNENAGLTVCPIHPQIVETKGISRTEAIKRMAKALYEHQYQKMRPLWEDEDNGYVEIYLKRAEAALNALLGE